MCFWLYMLLMDLLIPAAMLAFGRRFSKHPPKEINAIFGYRTAMSMKNQETWNFAHRYCGRIWTVCGLISMPVSVLALLAVFRKEIHTVGWMGGIVCAVQILVLIATLVPTELALRKNFTKDGTRIDPQD